MCCITPLSFRKGTFNLFYIPCLFSLTNFAATSDNASSSGQANWTVAISTLSFWSEGSFGLSCELVWAGAAGKSPAQLNSGEVPGWAVPFGDLCCALSQQAGPRASITHSSWRGFVCCVGDCANSSGRHVGLSTNTAPCLGQSLQRTRLLPSVPQDRVLQNYA